MIMRLTHITEFRIPIPDFFLDIYIHSNGYRLFFDSGYHIRLIII